MSASEMTAKNRQIRKELERLKEDRVFYGRMAGRAVMAVGLVAALIIAQSLGRPLIQMIIASIIGAAAGYLVGFFFLRKALMKKRERQISAQMDKWADEFMEFYEIS